MSSNITVKKTKNGTTITSSTNARSKKTQAELDAIKNKKNMTHTEIMKDMENEFAGKKKEKKNFLNLTTEDKKNMSLEELLELHRRMKDLGLKGKELNKGGSVIKNRMGSNDYRKGGYVLSTKDNRKTK
jgi:predicted P-loop ATPase/GTPase